MMRFNLPRLFVLAALVLLLSANSIQAGQEAADTSAVVTDIQVSFKLDSRITRGMYMGERWVSPPSYESVQTGGIFVVEARATVLGNAGTLSTINTAWEAADPDMIEVSPHQGMQVTITVKSAGQSSLTVSAQGFSKNLTIKARRSDNAMRVELIQ